MAPIVFDMFRNAAAPMLGNKTSAWAVGGSCFTAQSIVLQGALLGNLKVASVIWRITWLPNINNGSQTGVRLCVADSGPANTMELYSFWGKNNTTNPRNDAIDVTAGFSKHLQSHVADKTLFQFFTQSCGDSLHAPLIYSSALECVFE